MSANKRFFSQTLTLAGATVALVFALSPALGAGPAGSASHVDASHVDASHFDDWALAGSSDVAPAAAPTAAAVQISTGEDPSTVLASWARPSGQVVAQGVALEPAGKPGKPVEVIPVGADMHAVVLPRPPGGGALQATVTVVTTGGAVEIGPSQPFEWPARGAGGTRVSADSAPQPCLGASYGLGNVSVDGYRGFQGSYCLPPAFQGGTGAFCVDHGLYYPIGVDAYGWRPAVVGDGVPLGNQYGQAANPADLARAAWVLGKWAGSTDPARAVAIGIIIHAVMGDYPGLAVADLDPPAMQITGGDPASIAADVGTMWAASGSLAGPYTVTVNAGTGSLTVGRTTRGWVTVAGRGGVGEAGVPIDFSGSSGVTVTPDQPAVTGTDGSLGFTYTPTASSIRLAAAAAADLPGDGLTLWSPTTATVPVQRVVTVGPTVRPSASVTLAAQLPAQAKLVKHSSEPSVLAIGAGFGFDVQQSRAAGAWSTVAPRDTDQMGGMALVAGLDPGT
ncbi:MAG: hypothetical protein ACR2NJ_05905, partial [Acidimicrobiales bacterium]